MLKSELNRLLQQNGKNPQKQGEIVLFRTLRTALRNTGIAFTKEYHGISGWVEHRMRTVSLQKTARCEIADVLLLFIAEDGRMRYTFMQNKRDRITKYSPASPLRKIKANVAQWDLLHYRCPLTDPLHTRLPKDCLRGAILDSAASYGTFVNDYGAYSVDMSYNLANHLVHKKLGVLPTNTACKTFAVTTAYDRVYPIDGYWEIEGTTTLDDFAAAGQAMLVGSPIKENAGRQDPLAGLLLTYAFTCLQIERANGANGNNERYYGVLSRAAERYGVSLQAETILPYHLAVIPAKKTYFVTDNETGENPPNCLGARAIRDEEKARQLLNDENAIVFVDYKWKNKDLFHELFRHIGKNNYAVLPDTVGVRLISAERLYEPYIRNYH